MAPLPVALPWLQVLRAFLGCAGDEGIAIACASYECSDLLSVLRSLLSQELLAAGGWWPAQRVMSHNVYPSTQG